MKRMNKEFGSPASGSAKKVFLSCEEATFLISNEDEPLSIFEKLRLNFHLVTCSACTSFKKQWKYLSEKIKNISQPQQESKDTDILPEAFKLKLTRQIEEHIKNEKNN
jgi:hypothetical protein